MKILSGKVASILALSVFVIFTNCKEPKEETEIVEKVVIKEKPLKVETPQPSPFSTLEQKVGLTDVTITYSRPAMRGRTIFGDLVPYGETWRTGANANTTVTFSTDVTIGDSNVAAGTYALYSIPNKNSWEVMLYNDANNWGNPKKWDATKVVAKATVNPLQMPIKVESFTITVDDLTNKTAVLGLMWEDIYVGLPFTVPTDKAVMASINAVMAKEPTAQSFYDAAVYLKSEDKDLKIAITYIDKAVEMSKNKPKFWFLRQQSLIHAKLGKTETAIAAAKQSLALAEKAGNKGYVKMNKASLKEWEVK